MRIQFKLPHEGEGYKTATIRDATAVPRIGDTVLLRLEPEGRYVAYEVKDVAWTPTFSGQVSDEYEHTEDDVLVLIKERP